MCRGEHGAKVVFGRWNKDQVNVILHQAPSKATYLATRAIIRQRPKIKATTFVIEKDGLATGATLRDMMCNAWNDAA
jgi:hypothetical protein